jgi:hypothetical protein
MFKHFKKMLVLQLFFALILKMLQYFFKMLDNIFLKKSSFLLIFRQHFCKMLHQFWHNIFTNIFWKMSEAATAPPHGGVVASGQRPARSSRAPAMPSPDGSTVVRAPPEPQPTSHGAPRSRGHGRVQSSRGAAVGAWEVAVGRAGGSGGRPAL